MKVLFDTCTLVHLFNEATGELHQYALDVFNACQKNNWRIYLSTLTVAEYCVKGNLEPLLNKLSFRIISYDLRAAITAAEISKETLTDTSLRTPENGRNIIKVDTQIIANANAAELDYIVTADANSFAKTAERAMRNGDLMTKVVLLNEMTLNNLGLIEQETEAPVETEECNEEAPAAPTQLSLDLH